MKIWIAKDNTSAALTTIFTGSKPVLDGEGFWWQPNEGNCQSLYDFMFPDIKKGECKEFLTNDIYLSYHLDTFVEKVYDWLKNYAFVDDNKNVNLPTLLHDFLKDSRNF